MPEAADLPDDVEALKVELVAARALVIEQKIELEKLRFEIARLKRMKYGRSSEQLDTQIAQMQLTLEDLEATLAATPEPLRPPPKPAPIKPVRRALPAHLPPADCHIQPSPLMCWSRSTPSTCRCTGRARPRPARAWSLIAQRAPTGWEERVSCSSHS